eukprot:CAMPEP_0183342068 /NCGR_PEP_ID=MMETSP0164_2-20130417/8235_1 /TAXON_ID=221442 /ORGANISM="Coccolithus pelagicus ssp braarudi, Strain PLY182g" /LENGTH=48 /DNA_ID= /DNA_START= /DNA_END= /DNA_ORIENTATION=
MSANSWSTIACRAQLSSGSMWSSPMPTCCVQSPNPVSTLAKQRRQDLK